MTNMCAAANGQVESIGGFVHNVWETDGSFYYKNNTGSNISVNVTFNATWFTVNFMFILGYGVSKILFDLG
jgi:hypothetical protein